MFGIILLVKDQVLVNAFQMKNEFVIGQIQPLGLFHLVLGFWWLVFSRKSRC
jgi:hypothetical protein